MRGYSTMTDEERQSILSQHKTVYDGYATLQGKGNMTPLTVGDYALDKGGINVTNTGDVKAYSNIMREEKTGKKLVHIKESEFSPLGYAKKVVDGKMTVEDAMAESGIPFVILSRLVKNLTGKHIEMKEIEADDMDVSDVEPGYDYKSGGPEQFEPSGDDKDPYDMDLEAIQNMFDYEDIMGDGDTGADMMALQKKMDGEFDGKEDMEDEKGAYNFDSEGGNVDVYGESINEEGEEGFKTIAKRIMLSKKFDMVAAEMDPMDFSDEFEFADNFITYLLEDYDERPYYDELFDYIKDEFGEIILSMYGSAGEDDFDMYDEIDEDMHESFKEQRNKILENFNRFKKFN